MKPGEELLAGDIVTQYPGETFWVSEAEVAELGSTGKYVYAVGPMELDDAPNAKYFACINAVDFHADGSNYGHLLNTSHPKLVPPWDEPNCVFALYLEKLRFSIRKPPNFKLFIQCCRSISTPIDEMTVHNACYELRVDYHWQLAHEVGFWCLDSRCAHCIDSLHEFVCSKRHLVA